LRRRCKHEVALADIDTAVFTRPNVDTTQPRPVHLADILNQRHRFDTVYFARPCDPKQVTQHAAT
jgi:hypothetical protein